MRERVEFEATMLNKLIAERIPTVCIVKTYYYCAMQPQYEPLHEPWMSTDAVTSSCPDTDWAIQEIVVSLYAMGIFVRFNLPTPTILLNSVVILISLMFSIIV